MPRFKTSGNTHRTKKSMFLKVQFLLNKIRPIQAILGVNQTYSFSRQEFIQWVIVKNDWQKFDYIQPKADDIVTCYQPKCTMTSHITCLSKSFLSSKREESLHLLPVEGTCPRCQKPLLWGDIIRHKHGCYQNLEEVCTYLLYLIFFIPQSFCIQ